MQKHSFKGNPGHCYEASATPPLPDSTLDRRQDTMGLYTQPFRWLKKKDASSKPACSAKHQPGRFNETPVSRKS